MGHSHTGIDNNLYLGVKIKKLEIKFKLYSCDKIIFTDIVVIKTNNLINLILK